MNVTLLIENFCLDAIIGIQESERKQAQPLIIDLEVNYVYGGAGQYLDYMAILEAVQDKLSSTPYALLEEALEGISAWLKRCFPSITEILMSIKKPQVCQRALVGVRIHRTFD
ncbi:dihydroneopterin aldolase [Helicobacter salomonis]|uniref:dihydroneopterin aldolase n=1 Tax=Helicobacter salomonis TaxID=56878 RepID=UPI000CF01F48|nr:dihydroneopterin aldolase [Helicobacter salomonis]